MLKRLNEAKKVGNRLRRSLSLLDEKLEDAVKDDATRIEIERLTHSKRECANRLRLQADHLAELQVEARGSWL